MVSLHLPPYFDGLVAAFWAGQTGRFVHLGLWDEPPSAAMLAEQDAFAQAQVRLNENLLDLADIADGQRVLDVGCGFGGTLEVLNQRHRRMVLIGLNIDPRQLAICARMDSQPSNALHWLQADALALPLVAASIDRLLCFEAMFHFESRRRFFQEAARVLAPGGVMAASDIQLVPGTGDSGVHDAALVDAVKAGFGPWPDFWSQDADLAAIASGVGLTCTYHRDVAVETLPSHVFTAPAGRHPPRDLIGRAAQALAMLHRTGRLRYILARFESPPG